jgi:hypothetical protein
MNQQIASTTAGNGESTPHDLFALTDEQILEIEPEAQDLRPQPNGTASAAISSEARYLSSSPATDQVAQSQRDSSSPSAPRNDGVGQSAPDTAATSHNVEPPPWLAAQMKDPWTGEEARELWNGVQQAKSEAAAYRAAFANPEDARALKELYPGGVNEARAAAERARVLDDIDRAYFGAAGKSAHEVSASRAQLAQRMLREDPAAFREMVFAGLRALEESGGQAWTNVGSRFSATSAATESTTVQTGVGAAQTQDGLKSAPTQAGPQAQMETRSTDHDVRLAGYASFERAANEDLERSVGVVIERTLAQALPYVSRISDASTVGPPTAAGSPLQARLSQAIRQDVEAALKGDRQLGEQVAQILSGRRLDEETRGQVVRLIAERAQQLVPIAAKRVLSDWTQTTLAAHRSKNARADAASSRREVAPASTDLRGASSQAGSSASTRHDRGQDQNRSAVRSDARRVDYRKLSDEQILDL